MISPANCQCQLLQNNEPLWTPRRPEMSGTIKAGTILIKEGTLLPEAKFFSPQRGQKSVSQSVFAH